MTATRLLPKLDRAAPKPLRPELEADMLYGVEEIRQALGLKTQKQVYKLRERKSAPILYLEGVGLAARRSALEAWIDRKEAEALGEVAGAVAGSGPAR